MKRMLLSATMMVAMLGAFAQESVGGWSVQPMVGVNVATMTDSDGADPRVGLVGGIEAGYQATECFALSAGLLYSQQGVKASMDGVKGIIKMDYLNIPVLANVYVAKGLALKVGIQPGFLLNDKVEVKVSGVKAEVGIEESLRASGVDGDVKSLAFSVPVGISYDHGSIVLDARYNIGLSKALSAGSESTKHNVFHFTVGYRF